MSAFGTFAIDLEFYAPQTDLKDKSKIEMAQDLFYTQLMSLRNVTVIDKRNIQYLGTPSNPAPDTIVLYVEIREQGDTWLCTIHGEQPVLNKKISVTNTYNSFYMILTEAKSSLQQIISEITSSQETAKDTSNPSKQSGTTPSFELLSGTWSGEPNINKIVLLRGGRGFVIFNNGASMNIKVEIQGSTIVCTQTGKSNASFFPELPREVALVAALDADPIKWTLTLSDEKTLSGTKYSLQMVRGSGVGTELSATNVTWTRQ